MVQYKSPFPEGFLGVDLSYSGAWQPLGTDLDQSGVSVQHGARSEGGTPDVSSLNFTVKNGDGKYSPRNPMSPLYGLIGRNTPARATVALGAPWVDIRAASNSSAHTPSVANLNITGDIDIRWHGSMASWGLAGDLMSKYDTSGNQRSWIFRAEADGTLTLFHSANGSTLLPEARSTAGIPAWTDEIALRVTMDVNNGASGRTIRFYYAADLNSTWIQLGQDVVIAGTTSIFSSTAAFRLGKAPTSSANWPSMRVYGWELRAGIGGAIRSSGTSANMAQSTSTFTDTQARVWTLANSEVTNRHTIAVGEVAEWPVDWNTKGAPSVLTQVEASGITRRLGQGAQPVDSPVFRAISTAANSDLKAYYPMEEGSRADSFAPSLRGVRAGWVGDPELASYDGFGGSKPLPVLRTTRVRFRVPNYTATDVVQVRFLMHAPSSGWIATTVCEVNVSSAPGNLASVTLLLSGTTGQMRFLGRDENEIQLFDSGFSDWDVEDKDVRVSIRLTQSGGNVLWRVSTDTTEGVGLEANGSVPSVIGRCTSVLFNPSRNDMNTAIGHLTVQSVASSVHDVPWQVTGGYNGESAQSRIVRVAGEQGVSIFGRGANVLPVPMGPQPTATFLEILQEAIKADGGMLHDEITDIALRRRPLHAMGSQPPVVIPYQDNLIIPFKPIDDDALTHNRVTVQTPHASSVTVEQATGPMGTQPPSAGGVGLYENQIDASLGTDDAVERRANWELHTGTWDESRYPTLGVDLAHPYFLANPVLTRQLLSLNPGDHLVIENPPPWLPPFSVDVLVMGIQYNITPHNASLTWVCVPARPYNVAYWNAGHRYSGEGTTISEDLTLIETGINLNLPAGVTWTHADGDYDIVIGGEVMTVTDVVGSTMTVIRSVNGVVKTHAIGEAVQLAEPSFYAR